MSAAEGRARKVPQDHKKADADGQVEYGGVTYMLDMEAADDVEILDLVMQAEQDPRAGFEVARKVLGDEQWEAFADSVRTEAGRVPLTETLEFVKQVMVPLGKLFGSLLS